VNILLAARGLTVSIGETLVCRGLDLAIRPASRWAILGRNGVGKTTLLRALAGLHPPQEGSVSLNDEELSKWNRRDLARKLGVLLQQEGGLFPGKVLETALMGRHPHIAPWRWEGPEDAVLARSALQEVGLDGMEDRSLLTLSGGERQRLAIATLLAQAPDLYLLDEPTNHLDLHHQIQAMEVLCARVRGATDRALIVVLHDVNLAARFCDHALLLFGDGVVEGGRINEILTIPNVDRLYAHPVMAVQAGNRTFFVPG
jgi:iron complex transport system ATP-binding protein